MFDLILLPQSLKELVPPLELRMLHQIQILLQAKKALQELQAGMSMMENRRLRR